ncbi:stalk domain-containing protein [Paenibacillus odorifer]|uniref:C40 family peptidase n=1 Tax=Paenibacillus TaxID=44249 RepID=UPI00096C5C48|nr:stalk domain-containing protein [Paenibacillus odorifer]OMD25849.1 copper amine oxidase [Paenibacillus odorifer]OME28432.1 copper amine oxidase [Paenibacillus odorifer]OME36355.1 copper amine oxidase [Paenibacillus odorifer]OME42399.1 copper amine oxidase [Paenibacillus odorifer]
MKFQKKAMLLLLLTSMLYTAPAYAATTPQTPVTAVYLDDQQLQLEAQPLLVNDTVLVPMRKLFEAQGAKITWNNDTKTVKATKGDLVLTYHIGDQAANKNGHSLSVAVPGQIAGGYTMMPLRFVSEALGSTVKWDTATRAVRIYSAVDYDTTILYGVNLRSLPDSSAQSTVQQMLSAGDKVHVVREVDALWLEVRTQDNKSGYISAKPKYSNYTSAALVERQGNELLAYGEKYLGTPYEFGAATDQTSTFDCSSFVGHVFKDMLAIDLPRVSYNQAKEGKEVGINELRKGDLLFFSARGLDIGHVAIYAGNNQILHTYSKELGVHYEALSDKWKKRLVTARRLF